MIKGDRIRIKSNLLGKRSSRNGGAHNRAGNANVGQGKPIKCFNCNGLGHIARNCTQPKRPQNSDYFKDKMLLMQAQENGAVLDEEELLFLADECDAFDSDVDDEPTTQSIFMANLSSVGSANPQAGPSNASILSEVHILENAIDHSVTNQDEHEIHNKATELKIYKEQVAIYEQRAKFELTEREQRMDDQMRMLIQNHNKMEENHKKELHSVKLQLNSTMENNKIIEETITTLKQEFKQKVSKFLTDFSNLKHLNDKLKNKLHSQDQHTIQNCPRYLEKRKAEELKANAPPLPVLPPATVYPPNTPVHLVPRTLPTTSQVNIGLYVITQLFWDFEKTCKKRITPTGITEGERGFEQTKRCYLTEVIPFFNLLKEHFDEVQKSLVTEVRAMKAVFENLEAEVDQNEIDLKSGEIERKNLLITNENLIVECLSKDVFYTATDYVLNVSRFSDMHDAFTIAQKRIADLESENFNLRNKIQNDDHDSMIKHFSKLEVEHFNLQLKYQNLKERFGNKKPVTSSDAPSFDSLFVIRKLKEQIQSRGNTICELKEKISRLTKKNSDADPIFDLKALVSQNKDLTAKLNALHDLNECFRAENAKGQLKDNSKCVTIHDSKPKVLAPDRYPIDVEPIPPRLKKNREVHLYYIKHLKENVETLCEIVEDAKVERPLDTSLASAFRYTKHSQELLEYVVQIVLWYLDSGCSKHMTGDRSRVIGDSVIPGYICLEGLGYKPSLCRSIYLTDYYESVGITHEKTVLRTPQQKMVLIDDRIAFVEAARTLLIFQSPLFSLDRSCGYYMLHQKRFYSSLHNKNHMQTSHDKKTDLLDYVDIWALCYPKQRHAKILAKLKAKADIGFFVGYVPHRKGYRIYNKRTRQIMDTIHVTFDELTKQTAPVHFNPRPAHNLLTPGPISSGLIPNPPPVAPYVPPIYGDGSHSSGYLVCPVNDHSTTVTETTTTTTVPPPPPQPQQDVSTSILTQTIGQLEQNIADLVDANQALEERLDKQGNRIHQLETQDLSRLIREQTVEFIDSQEIDRKIKESVKEVVTASVHHAMRAPLRARFKDLPTSDMKEILLQRIEQFDADKVEERTKKKTKQDSPKTPPGSPPPPLPHLPPSSASGASGSSKTAASTTYIAWTTTTSRLKSAASSVPEDVLMHEESDFEAHDMGSDDEDSGSRHIPKVSLNQEWFKPLSEKERPATPEPAWSIPSSSLPVPNNNWASALASSFVPPPENSLLSQTGDIGVFIDWFCKKQGITELTPEHLEGPAYEVVKAFHPDVIHLQFQMEECHKLLTNQVDEGLLRYNVSRPLPLGGPPGQVTIQTEFFFNKDLEYLRFGHKGDRLASPEPPTAQRQEDSLYCRQLMDKEFGYQKTGLEFIDDYKILDSPRAVVFRDKYGMQMIMCFNEIHKFSDGTLHQIDEALDYRVKEYKVNKVNPRLNTRFWTTNDVIKSKQFSYKVGKVRYSFPRSCQSWRDPPRDNPLVSVEVLRNPVKEILFKMNLPDHRSVLTDLEGQVKIEMEIPHSSRVNSQPHAHT
ncbi:integrase, catalytic region, zinc finger, CCHC-type containing protein [Tanacetum coccineum]|uniref:Integrase, catalytic region, zinc finger, CCHC-type containing protein n=1 Tax=Tanacetum coccineum TaxID=301880 RepID=A0ABQ5BSD2_9ASTR